MSLSYAFEITEDDVANVLRNNLSRVANTNGRSFDGMAVELFGEMDCDRVAAAALDSGTDLVVQTGGAYREIEQILIEDGVLDARRMKPAGK